MNYHKLYFHTNSVEIKRKGKILFSSTFPQQNINANVIIWKYSSTEASHQSALLGIMHLARTQKFQKTKN